MGVHANQTLRESDFEDESSGAAEKIPITKADGRLDPTFLVPDFGDGSDGDVVISSPTTLTRDMFYNNLTVTSTLTTGGFRIFVKDTLDGAGTIDASGVNPGGNGVGRNHGAGAAASGGRFRTTPGSDGGDGGSGGSSNGAAGTAGITPDATYSSQNSQAGADGGQTATSGGVPQHGPGGAGATAHQAIEATKSLFYAMVGLSLGIAGAVRIFIAPGAGGGGGGCSRDGTSPVAGGGGGGGESGNLVFIMARIWAGTFTIKSRGTKGGDAGNAAGSGRAAGGGGGAGGNGGVSLVIYLLKTWAGSYDLIGGVGGAAGSSIGATSPGNTGPDGNPGEHYEIQAGALI